jgi:hypothetical protein
LTSQWLASERPADGAASEDKERAQSGAAAGSQSEHSPTRSPWWSAPAGRPVAIPAFARGLLEVLLDLLMPKPVLVPVKVRAPRRPR